jgi:hypothetical protein
LIKVLQVNIKDKHHQQSACHLSLTALKAIPCYTFGKAAFDRRIISRRKQGKGCISHTMALQHLAPDTVVPQ